MPYILAVLLSINSSKNFLMKKIAILAYDTIKSIKLSFIYDTIKRIIDFVFGYKYTTVNRKQNGHIVLGYERTHGLLMGSIQYPKFKIWEIYIVAGFGECNRTRNLMYYIDSKPNLLTICMLKLVGLVYATITSVILHTIYFFLIVAEILYFLLSPVLYPIVHTFWGDVLGEKTDAITTTFVTITYITIICLRILCLI